MTQPHTISFFLFASHSFKKPECNTKYLERHIKKLNKPYKRFTPEIQRELLMIIHETRIVLNVLFAIKCYDKDLDMALIQIRHIVHFAL